MNISAADTSLEYEKKKIYKKVLMGLILAGLVVIGLGCYGVYWAFYDMDRLPQGELLTEDISPDGKYSLKAYVVSGGATTSFSIRGELVFHEKDDTTETIYWNEEEKTANIVWKDNNTVIINGHTLDVPGEKFDFRHE